MLARFHERDAVVQDPHFNTDVFCSVAFNPRKNPRCDKKREKKFLFFCHFLLMESRLPAVSELGGGVGDGVWG